MDLHTRNKHLIQPFSDFQVRAGGMEMAFRYQAENTLTLQDVDLLDILVLNPLYYDGKCARLHLPLNKYNT